MSRADDFIADSGDIDWTGLAVAFVGSLFLTIFAGVQSVSLSMIEAVALIRDEIAQKARWLIGDVFDIPAEAISAGGRETATWTDLAGTWAAPITIGIVLAGFGLAFWVRDNA